MEDFEALNIKSIPRRRNMVVDALEISTSALQPIKRKKISFPANPKINSNKAQKFHEQSTKQ